MFVVPDKRQSPSVSPTPDTFALAKGDEEEEVQAKAQEDGTGEQVSAADYDPCLDRREDEHKRVWGTKEEPRDIEMVEEEEEEEDVDDMFAVATSEKKVKKLLGGDLTVLTSNGKVVFFEATQIANMAKEYGATTSTIRTIA